MTSAKFLWLLRDFVPEYHHAKFGYNWTTDKGETEGGTMCPPPSLYGSKDSSMNRVNHMLERGSKMFSCFLDVRKAFDTVWIDGLMYKLFSDLTVNFG